MTEPSSRARQAARWLLWTWIVAVLALYTLSLAPVIRILGSFLSA